MKPLLAFVGAGGAVDAYLKLTGRETMSSGFWRLYNHHPAVAWSMVAVWAVLTHHLLLAGPRSTTSHPLRPRSRPLSRV